MLFVAPKHVNARESSLKQDCIYVDLGRAKNKRKLEKMVSKHLNVTLLPHAVSCGTLVDR